MIEKLKLRARALKNEAYAVYLAAKSPRTPWYAKALIFFVVAHTFSPIDLILDFIPCSDIWMTLSSHRVDCGWQLS